MISIIYNEFDQIFSKDIVFLWALSSFKKGGRKVEGAINAKNTVIKWFSPENHGLMC